MTTNTTATVDVRTIAPLPDAVEAKDPARDLWSIDPDACCHLRKVEPLAEVLAPFAAWINGRKRYHGGERAAIPLVEADGTRLKFNPLDELAGKRVVVVDDSIVRGSTSGPIVDLVRRNGAREVHMRICSPPIRWSCHFGVDMARKSELVAARLEVEAIRKLIGADTLGYLSLGGMVEATSLDREHFCTACFTGDYPIPVQLELTKEVLEVGG